MTRQLANITANFARGSAIEVEPPHFGTTPRIGVHPRAAASIIDINYTLAPEAYGFFGIDADYSAYSEGWKNRKVYLPLLRLDCQDDSGEVTSEGVFGAPKCPVSGVIDSSASVGAVVESSEAVIGSTAPSDRPRGDVEFVQYRELSTRTLLDEVGIIGLNPLADANSIGGIFVEIEDRDRDQSVALRFLIAGTLLALAASFVPGLLPPTRQNQ